MHDQAVLGILTHEGFGYVHQDAVHCEKELSDERLDTPVMGVSYTLVELNYLWLYKEVSNSI